mmetsp:Transcript_3330/g.10191  ORF Transcript_3330/g.10191 Transcript_3330/m.10191 type:complete len:242 (-) Transcript_3330:762-1487(-)
MPNDVVPPPVQLLAVGVVAALPMAILGVLPTAILGDIVVHASRAAALYAAKRPREATDLAAVATRAAVSSASGKPHTSGITVSRSSSFAPDVADNIEGIEGMFFAARTFIQKLGTTIGVAVMASLTSYGELGIRMSAVFGIVLAVVTLAFFVRYDEATVLSEGELMSMRSSDGANHDGRWKDGRDKRNAGRHEPWWFGVKRERSGARPGGLRTSSGRSDAPCPLPLSSPHGPLDGGRSPCH